MKKLFSPTTGGFYTTRIHKDNIPSDAFEVGKDEEQEIRTALSSGKIVEGGGKSGLKLKDKPKPSKSEREANARSKRNNLLRSSDWSQIPDCPLAGNQEVLNYRQALRDVPLQEGFPDNINWPEKPEVL